MEGLLQPTHLMFVFAIVLLIFGPKKLPDLGRGLGKGIRELKDAVRDAVDVKPVVFKCTGWEQTAGESGRAYPDADPQLAY
jgi:sec-independent protein translocase protein TatA